MEWLRDPGIPLGVLVPSWGGTSVSGRGCWWFSGDAVPSQVRVKLRPHVQQFLESLSKTYEVPGGPLFPWGLWGPGEVHWDVGAGQLVQGLSPAPPDRHLHHGKTGLCQEGPGCAGPQEEADQVMWPW